MKALHPLLMIGFCLLVAACASEEHSDIRQWMKENTKDLRGGIPPLPKVVPYQPVPYLSDKQVDPFASSKIEPNSQNDRDGAGKGGKFRPNFEAREERNNLLEKYPLESIKMIGFLNVNHQPMAVVHVDKHVKQVKRGDYIGQDFGIVIEINEQQMVLKELVQDSAGDWTERTSTLQLQSKEGSKK